MKKIHVLTVFAVLIFLGSCNPKISTSIRTSYQPLDYKQDVVVIGLDKAEPNDSEYLGEVKIGDSGFSINCGYDVVIDQAKLEARKVGGNAIKIIKHNRPDIISSCHRITVRVLRLKNI